MTRASSPIVDVLIQTSGWTRELASAAMVCRRAARTAWAHGAPTRLKRRAATSELSILLTGDRAIRGLNRTYRGQDKATNVLSFPAGDDTAPGKARARIRELILGDVVVAYGTVAREARQAGKSLKDHLSHMVVHGVLHLLGYDHETAPDAETMERLEIKILSQLGVDDPYARLAATPTPVRGARRQT